MTFDRTERPLSEPAAHLPETSPRPPRVLFVTPRYAPLVGGVEQHVFEVGRRLAAAGSRVRVLTTDPSGELPVREDVNGVEIRRVRAWPRRRDYYFAPGVIREVLAGRGDWDVVHIQSYHTFVAPFAMLAARRAGIPYVLTFHGGGHSSPLRQLVRRAQRLVLRPPLSRASRLIGVARFEVGLYSSMFGLPTALFEVISNGVDIPVSGPIEPPSGSLIASVGRLERYKGHQRMIAALPLVIAARPDARLWIAGSGPYEQALRDQAAALGVSDRVDIHAVPPNERERMVAELKRAAVVVLLSEYETQPLAILEAVALGRPAVVADTSGMTELAERGLAVAIPLESSPSAVAAAVIGQLESPLPPKDERLPTWDDCADLLLNLYLRVIDEYATANPERRP